MELHNSAKGMKSNNPKGGWYWSSSLLLSFFSSLAVDAMAFNAICSIPFLNRCSVPLKCSKAMKYKSLIEKKHYNEMQPLLPDNLKRTKSL